MEHKAAYDSFLLVSFGGPEGPADVMPFLENVLRGKNVPAERMQEVAEHYQHFGGVSPINSQNRALLRSLEESFAPSGLELPIYWGNRNWHPLLTDTLQQMRDRGHRRTLAFFTSMFSCYSGCRQYRENIEAARAAVGPDAPQVDKLRMAFNHPGFIEPMADNVRVAMQQLGGDAPPPVAFTAHSIPTAMADHSDYVKQLRESCRLVARESGIRNWTLVYQSRSGPPEQPWLEPDICDWIESTDERSKMRRLIIAPIGFISDHMEVLYDLDHEAAKVCRRRGITMARAATVGTDLRFVQMIHDLVVERIHDDRDRPALGKLGPWHDVCPADCCLYPRTRPQPATSSAQTEPEA